MRGFLVYPDLAVPKRLCTTGPTSHSRNCTLRDCWAGLAESYGSYLIADLSVPCDCVSQDSADLLVWKRLYRLFSISAIPASIRAMSIEHFALIKEMYRQTMPKLLADYPKLDPYFMDWSLVFTPIESNVWADIRAHGLPMLPQFPVDKYFIDFAYLVKKIGIEVDGKQWHQDGDKDYKRQAELENVGWKIFRITGAATFYGIEGFDDEDDHHDLPTLLFLMNGNIYNCSAEYALKLIREQYYPRPDPV